MKWPPRVLYLAHGRAGYECLNLLTGELGVPPENILGFSYRLKESIPIVQRFEVLGIPYSTERLNLAESRRQVASFRPDVIASIHFRDIIPQSLIDEVPMGGFNLHPSLLPKYRGCFSGPWAIIHQEVETGISYHYITRGVDEGRLIFQERVPIARHETGYSLFEKLVDLGVRRFAEVFKLVTEARFRGTDQVGTPSYFRRAIPFGGIIQPGWTDSRIDAFIRALYFPGFRGALYQTRDGLKEVQTFAEYLALRTNE